MKRSILVRKCCRRTKHSSVPSHSKVCQKSRSSAEHVFPPDQITAGVNARTTPPPPPTSADTPVKPTRLIMANQTNQQSDETFPVPPCPGGTNAYKRRPSIPNPTAVVSLSTPAHLDHLQVTSRRRHNKRRESGRAHRSRVCPLR